MCHCKDFGDYVEIWHDGAPSFNDGFRLVAKRNDTELRSCDACGTCWQVDVDRGGLAIRISNPNEWDKFDDRPVRLRQLIAHHGGFGDEQCSWIGCGRRVLNGMKLCAQHAYPLLHDD